MPKPESNDQNLALCSCPKCPTYNECSQGKNEKFFCSLGPGTCVYKTNGCICGGCPIYKLNKLKFGYYCRKKFNE